MDDILTILAFAGWFAIGFGCGYKYTKRKTKHINLSNDEIYEVCKDVPFVVIGPDYDLAIARAVIAADKEKNK